MNFQTPVRLQRESQGSVAYTSSNTVNPGGVPFAGARNGLTIDAGGFAVLGNDAGGSGAILLNNREIPMGGFSALFTQVNQTPAGFFGLKYDVTKTLNSNPFVFQDSTGAQIFKINVINNGTNNSIYIGTGAGANVTSNAVRNIGIGLNALGTITTQNFNVAVGWGCMSLLATGQLNVGMGLGTLQNITDGSSNTAIGVQSMLNQTNACNNNTGLGNGTMANTSGGAGSQDNVCIGSLTGFFTGAIPFDFTKTVIIGSQAFRNAATIGNSNVIIGYFINSAGSSIGANNILIGANIQQAAGGMTNSTMIGHDITVSLSNVVVLGRADQNIILGLTVAGADNGAKLQVQGNITTGGAAPLTLGAGKLDFGKIVTAASVLNATKYWEVSVDGVLVKVCIN